MKRVILNQTAVEEVAMATEVVEHSKKWSAWIINI